LRNLFSDKAFAAGIDAANSDKDGLFDRSSARFATILEVRKSSWFNIDKLPRRRVQPSACCLNW
jgi:hypothetical protein